MPQVWFPYIGIEIKNLPRVAFNLFGLDVYFYGVSIFLAFVAAIFLITAEARRTGQNEDYYYDFFLYAFIFGIIGARLYYVMFSWSEYSVNLLSIFAIRQGGLAIYGGIIAGVITAIVFTKIKKIDFWLFADTCVPGILIGQVIGRLGNFFNREAFGSSTNSFLAMRLLVDDVYAIPQSILDKAYTINGVQYIQVHPTFLYEMLWNAAVLIGLLIFARKGKKKFDGQIFALYLLFYGLGRFFIEMLRSDQLLFFGTGMAASQIVSVIVFVFSIVVLFTGKNRKQPDEPDKTDEQSEVTTE